MPGRLDVGDRELELRPAEGHVEDAYLEALPDAELPVARRSGAQRAVHERNVVAVSSA